MLDNNVPEKINGWGHTNDSTVVAEGEGRSVYQKPMKTSPNHWLKAIETENSFFL